MHILAFLLKAGLISKDVHFFFPLGRLLLFAARSCFPLGCLLLFAARVLPFRFWSFALLLLFGPWGRRALAVRALRFWSFALLLLFGPWRRRALAVHALSFLVVCPAPVFWAVGAARSCGACAVVSYVIYICIYIYIYTYIYIYMYVCIYIYIYTYTCT